MKHPCVFLFFNLPKREQKYVLVVDELHVLGYWEYWALAITAGPANCIQGTVLGLTIANSALMRTVCGIIIRLGSPPFLENVKGQCLGDQ